MTNHLPSWAQVLLSETSLGQAAAQDTLESYFSFFGGNSNLLLIIPLYIFPSFHIMCQAFFDMDLSHN